VARDLTGLLEMMQQLVNGMNESKRPFLIDVLVTRNAEIVGQVSSCDRMSEVGSLRRIRGKITILDVKLTTTEQHDGSSKAYIRKMEIIGSSSSLDSWKACVLLSLELSMPLITSIS
jgi:hypothetical protein